jgi:hypothetical protein
MQLANDNQLYRTILYILRIIDFKMPNIKTPYHLNSGANKIVADVKRPTLLKIREFLQGHLNCKENNFYRQKETSISSPLVLMNTVVCSLYKF